MTIGPMTLSSETKTTHYLYRKYLAAKKEVLVGVASHILRQVRGVDARESNLRSWTKEKLAMVVAESDMAALQSENYWLLVNTRKSLFAA